MDSIQILNERGYKELRSLADGKPEHFMQPNPDRLRSEMIKNAGTEDVWERQIDLRCSLAELNGVDKSGPSTDYDYVPIVRTAFADISQADAGNELFWASVNCFAIADYVPKRWDTGLTAKTNLANFVDSHWLKGGAGGREANAAARLWWLGELSERVASHSKILDALTLLDAMANHVNLYHQTLARPYLAANPRLLAAIYEAALDGNEHLYQTQYANPMFKSLNLRAGATALDLMDDDELRAVVREAVPPKKP